MNRETKLDHGTTSLEVFYFLPDRIAKASDLN